ncbi:MAG: hypothetical protein ACP5XB_12790 [Isosphaeraceae bacterium]
MRTTLTACAVFLLGILAAWADADDLASPVHVQDGGTPIDVQNVGHSAPFLGDFDGDGVRDLLVGQFDDGRLRIYRNLGSNTSPRFKGYKWFEAGGTVGKVPAG